MGIPADERLGKGSMVVEQDRVVETADDSVALRGSGERAHGSFRCVGCGYGVVVAGELPLCPMCGGDLWDESRWRPFARPREAP